MNTNDKEFIVQKIRTQYTEKEHTGLDELKELDKKVKRPANAFAYTFGTVGSLVLGAGMSFAMGVIGSSVPLGVAIGCVGIAMVSVTYSLYKKMLESRKKKYAAKILEISDRILETK